MSDRDLLKKALSMLGICTPIVANTESARIRIIAEIEERLNETDPEPIGYANIKEIDLLKSPMRRGCPVFVSKEQSKGRMAIYSEPGHIGWRPIETIPHFKFVQAYSKKYHEGPGKEKNGVMVVCYRPKTETRPAEFADDFGISVNWDFSYWIPMPNQPEKAHDISKE
jgi:hypothetical protein